MKLVIGLGNPGSQYQGTRHNIGFDVLEQARQYWQGGKPQLKFQSEIVELSVNGEKWILQAPLTYMNLSGQAVQAAVKFFKIELTDLIVICDDLNLPTGQLRLRASGSAGGQKGLANIIQQLGTEEFSRLRVGIGRPSGSMSTVDYVLGRFGASERSQMAESVEFAVQALAVWAKEGIATAMNRFNASAN